MSPTQSLSAENRDIQNDLTDGRSEYNRIGYYILKDSSLFKRGVCQKATDQLWKQH